uniref:Uncharacterized protein n=1 Tax=Anopheles minimus TaxID=112268 RepID=A0A182WMR4_9DIPT
MQRRSNVRDVGCAATTLVFGPALV